MGGFEHQPSWRCCPLALGGKSLHIPLKRSDDGRRQTKMYNYRFWASHFQRSFVPHLRRLRESFEKRLLPAFANLDAEAQEIQTEAFDRFNQMPSDEHCDPTWPAEMAHDEALDHYMGMSAVRQTLLNASAPILYHAWEQQLLSFHRREILHPSESDDPKLLSLEILQKRLAKNRINFASLPSWKTITELKHAANAVKHADGPSAEVLKTKYPNLLENPALDDSEIPKPSYRARVYSPLSGNDIFIRQTDLQRYSTALIEFWSELASALADVQTLAQAERQRHLAEQPLHPPESAQP